MFRIVPIPTAVAREAPRVAHATQITVSEAIGGPCRLCLADGKPGERLTLFTYEPFAQTTPYRELGPVFVHADGCAAYDALPDTIPNDYMARRVVVRGYDERGWIHAARVAEPGALAETIAEIFSDDAVSYAHVRHLGYGCYAFRVERA